MFNNEKTQLQSCFLTEVQEKDMETTIFLSNGIKLQGKITSFDNESILLKRNNSTQLVYKNSIATILPLESIGIDGNR